MEASKHYNARADVFVKLIPIHGEEEAICHQPVWTSRCTCKATFKAILGDHSSITCDCPDHIESAISAVAQAFVEEMMDLYGNVPERRTLG